MLSKVSRIISFKLSLAFIPLLLTVSLAPFLQADTGALDATRQFVTQALHILADKQVPVAQRSAQLRQLLEPNFDFTEMSRSALGYHWKQLSPDQRANFTQVFKAFIESAYSSKINEYAGQKVEFIREAPLSSGYAQVFTNIVQAGKNPIAVNYLLEQKNGWKVYDVTVDNISIIANYRTQFNRVVNENGFDKLLADLKAKEQQINASLAA